MAKKATTADEYLKRYFKARKQFIHKKEIEGGFETDELTTYEKFKDRVESKLAQKGLDFTKENVKKQAQELLNTRLYKSYEEVVHKNLTDILKKEGMTSRLYRMGGKTAFSQSSYVSEDETRSIEGKDYKSSGYYKMGNVKVIIWTSVIGSREQYIEFINQETGNKWLQMRKGSQD